MDREHMTELKSKNEIHGRYKWEAATWENYRGIVQACRFEMKARS